VALVHEKGGKKGEKNGRRGWVFNVQVGGKPENQVGVRKKEKRPVSRRLPAVKGEERRGGSGGVFRCCIQRKRVKSFRGDTQASRRGV